MYPRTHVFEIPVNHLKRARELIDRDDPVEGEPTIPMSPSFLSRLVSSIRASGIGGCTFRQKDLALCKKCDIKNPLTRHNFFMSSSGDDNKEDTPKHYELITRLLGFPNLCLVVIETVENSVLLTLER